MKKILSLSAFAALTSAFFACSEAPNDDNFVDTTGTLQVIVKDARTDSLLTAEVQMFAVDSKARQTDAKGSVVYRNLPISSSPLSSDGYAIRVSAEGYEPMLCDVSGLRGGAVENIYVVQNRTFEAPLYKKGVNVEGFLTYTNQEKIGNTFIPVSGESLVEFNIDLTNSDCEFENRSIFANVENGVYKFENLPENVGFYISFKDLKVNDSLSFLAMPYSIGNQLGNAGSTFYATADNYNNPSTSLVPFKVTKLNVNTFRELESTTTAIEITFSKPVDTDEFDKVKPVALSGVDVVCTWNEDNTILTVTPQGGWDNGGMNTYVYIPAMAFYSTNKEQFNSNGLYIYFIED